MGIWMNVIWTKVRLFDFVAVINKRNRTRHGWRNIEFCTYFQKIISHTSTRFYCRIYIQCYMQFRQDFYQSICIAILLWCDAPTFAKEFSAQVGLGAWEQAQWGLQAGERGAWLPNCGTFRSKTIVLLLYQCLFQAMLPSTHWHWTKSWDVFSSFPKKVVDSWWQHDIMHRHPLVRRYLCV